MGFESAGREAMLLAELQHRVRSTLATTRMIVRRSAETSENLEDYVAHLDGRLAALARVQNAAIRDPMTGIDLGILMSDEVAGAGLGTSTQLEIAGPTIAIHPRAAEPLALALHELLTNALKFGALSAPEGRLAISWQVETSGGIQQLVLDWIETGMHLEESGTRRRGFGSVVLLDMLEHNLGAHTVVRVEPTGLSCRIAMPVDERLLAPLPAEGATRRL